MISSTTLSANASHRNSIEDNLSRVEQRIHAACSVHDRKREDIQLLAVSKRQPPERIRQAYALGLRHFGESYLQEAMDKMPLLPDDCTWHFIGPVQSNKTRLIAEHFHWLHSLDRHRIADRLNAQRPAGLPPLKVCVQVNISDETSKSGVSCADVPGLIDHVLGLPCLQLEGLMCLPARQVDLTAQRAAFRTLRELRNEHAPQTRVLSMGMSEDLEAAIAEGSTIVRVGTDIFGPRPSATETP